MFDSKSAWSVLNAPCDIYSGNSVAERLEVLTNVYAYIHQYLSLLKPEFAECFLQTIQSAEYKAIKQSSTITEKYVAAKNPALYSSICDLEALIAAYDKKIYALQTILSFKKTEK